jgi:ADP-L-glycero-D-manno-heptose 6-epimerase
MRPRNLRLYEIRDAFKRRAAGESARECVNIVVTGANGFVGRRIVDRCVAAGHRVVAVGRKIARSDCRVLDARFDRIDWSEIGAADVLIHLAAINDTSVRDEGELRRVNVDAAIECMAGAVKAGCRRVVYASSMHVYGNVPSPMTVDGSPTAAVSPYGRSKLRLEREAAAFAARQGVGCIGLRLANVYGPGESHKGRMASQVFQLARQMRAGDPEIFFPGTQVRDFVHVDDAASAAVAAAMLEGDRKPAILNCGSGLATTFNQLVEMLNAAMGLSRTPRYVPEPPGYLREVVLDIAATRNLLDWRPRSLAKGIADYLASGEFG